MGRLAASGISALAVIALWSVARAAPLAVDADTSSIELAPVTEMLEDPDGTLGLEQVLAASDRFRSVGDTALNAGFTSSAYWLRFELELPAQADARWLVELDFTQLDDVTLYALADDGRQHVVHTGDRERFASRDVAAPNFVFRLPTALGSHVRVYVRVRSSGGVLVPLTLWRQDSFAVESGRRGLGWGIYYGFLLALALYNLCLYSIVRDRSYLYYLGYLVAMLGFQASLAGHGTQYLWGAWPWFATNAAGTFLGISVSLAMLFICDMAAVATTSPRLHKPMLGWAAALAAAVPLMWLSYGVGIRLITALSVAALVFSALPIAQSYRRGYRPARYLVAAIALILPGGLLLGLRSLGVVPETFATVHGVQIATAAEALVLSFALADRISLLREAALEAHRNLSRKLIAAQDAERKRIAGELHDGLGQNVLVLANGLTRLDGDAADELASLAQQTAEDVRTVAHQLHPGKLELVGLAAAIETSVEQALRAAEVDGDCRVDPEVERVLDPEARIHVYRIVQEALANAIRHANATEIAVRVRRAGDRVEVRIEDDGVGLAPGLVRGLGLAGIEERARALDGAVRLVSRPGEGVRVEVDLPLPVQS